MKPINTEGSGTPGVSAISIVCAQHTQHDRYMKSFVRRKYSAASRSFQRLLILAWLYNFIPCVGGPVYNYVVCQMFSKCLAETLGFRMNQSLGFVTKFLRLYTGQSPLSWACRIVFLFRFDLNLLLNLLTRPIQLSKHVASI